MWVRKSEEQAARERSRRSRSFGEPAALAAVCFLCFFGKLAEAPRFPGQHGPYSWSEILGFSTFAAAVVAIAGYVVQVACQRPLSSVVSALSSTTVVMCDTCHRVKRRDREQKCECGGTFDDFENWTWIEGDEEEEDV
jgi:hypothetical protein